MNTGKVQAAILAGGKGSRFWPLTDLIPKPLIPVGEHEKPILEYIVTWLSKNGIRRIALLVGYRNKQIQNYFGNGDRWGVEIRYSYDDPYDPNTQTNNVENGYSGTGGALLKAVHNNTLTMDTILVWYGDIIADINTRDLLRKHWETRAAATLVLAENYQVPVGIPTLQGDNITSLQEKPWININPTIGILAIEKTSLLETAGTLGRNYDIMADLIPHIIRKGKTVKAYIHHGHWYDIGSIERYQKIPSQIQYILKTMIDN